MARATVLTSPFLAVESPEETAGAAGAVIARAEATLLSRFADQIVSLIASSPGAADPDVRPESPPVRDPIVLLVTRAPIPSDELSAARAEIRGPSPVMGNIELFQSLRRDLTRLPPHPRLIDLASDYRTIAGEAVRLPAPPLAEEIPVVQGELLLREALGDIIAGFPEGDGAAASLRSTSRAVLAAVDALLILKQRYSARLDEKRRQIVQIGGDEGILDLFDAAVSTKIEGRTPSAWSAGRFWGASLHFFLDVLLAFLVPGGPRRSERLDVLLEGYGTRSVSFCETLRRFARALLAGPRKGDRERLLLALAIARDWDAPRPSIGRLARRAGIPDPRGLSWNDLRERALAAWRGDVAPAR